MNIFGISGANPLASALAGHVRKEDMTFFKDVKGEAIVNFDDVSIKHENEEKNYRPYMEMIGTAESFTPRRGKDDAKLPYGIEAIEFGGYPLPVIFRYDFSDEELKVLIEKGYFGEGFSIPKIFTDSAFELPVKCDVSVIAPEKNKPLDKDNVPFVIARINNPFDYKIDGVSSGYENLATYWPDKAASVSFRDALDNMYKDEPEETAELRKAVPIFSDPELQVTTADIEMVLGEIRKAQPEEKVSSSDLYERIKRMPKFARLNGVLSGSDGKQADAGMQDDDTEYI